MDAQKYGRLTSSPLFISRPILEETAAILQKRSESATEALNRLFEESPLTKPEKHTGDSSTDYFDTTGLSDDILESICDNLFEAEADAVPSSGETTAKASRIASLVDLWHERNEVDVTPMKANSKTTLAEE